MNSNIHILKLLTHRCCARLRQLSPNCARGFRRRGLFFRSIAVMPSAPILLLEITWPGNRGGQLHGVWTSGIRLPSSLPRFSGFGTVSSPLEQPPQHWCSGLLQVDPAAELQPRRNIRILQCLCAWLIVALQDHSTKAQVSQHANKQSSLRTRSDFWIHNALPPRE